MRMFRQDRPECRYELKRVLEAEAAGVFRFRRAPERAEPTWRDFMEQGGFSPSELAEIMDGPDGDD